MKYKTTFKIKPPFTPAKDLAIFSKIITKTLSKLLLKKLVNVLHQLDKLILTFITKYKCLPQSITQKTKINIQSYIFGVQHKSVIELTLLQIGGLNEYDKIVCHSCLYNSNMYCLCNLIT